MATDSTIIISRGLDWLTTTHIPTRDKTDWSTDLWEWLNTAYEPNRAEWQDWSALGFAGYKARSVRFGVREPDEVLVMVSGDDTDTIANMLRPKRNYVTRVDFQVTVRLSRPDPDVGKRVYDFYRTAHDTNPNRPKSSFLHSITGQTCYIGQRASDRMLRFYDKSKDYPDMALGEVWRYEVEYKGDRARRAYREWSKAKGSVEYVADQVFAEYRKSDITPMYDATTEVDAIEVVAEPSNVDKQVSWLRRCVRPVVGRLINHGYEQQVLDALGIRGRIDRVHHPVPLDGLEDEYLDIQE